ncbi:MAG: peptidoglycan editing factor PgeF [Parvibaculales bacterium]
MLDPLTHDSLSVKHGFFTRKGGVSKGLYAGLNVGFGSNDAPDKVAENRQRVADDLGVSRIMTLHQTHSSTVQILKSDTPLPDDALLGDALITDRDDISIGVLTADCAPVLFYAPQAGWIGAAHAGWRGALSGIIESTATALRDMTGAQAEIRAVVGPCISAPNYEVDLAFQDRFLQTDQNNEVYFSPATRDGHTMFDLQAYVGDRCRQAGCTSVNRITACTYAEPDRFYSYRRSCHRKEPDYGRQISAISLKEL